MTQFCLYRNRGPDPARAPYLLDLQADTLSVLEGRVVAPLRPVALIPGELRALHPRVTIDDEAYFVSMGELAGVPGTMIGPQVADLRQRRGDFIAALDLLFTGY